MKRSESATAYIVSEFFEVKLDDAGIDVKASLKMVRTKAQNFAGRKGCYVYFNRGPNQSRKPIYVGLTKKNTLVNEAFSPRTVGLINKHIYMMKKSRVELAFIVPEQNRGATPQSQIKDMEKVLVAIAADKNPKLLNTHHIHEMSWYIKGVLFAKQGEDSAVSRNFRTAIGVRTNPMIVYK